MGCVIAKESSLLLLSRSEVSHDFFPTFFSQNTKKSLFSFLSEQIFYTGHAHEGEREVCVSKLYKANFQSHILALTPLLSAINLFNIY